jgi:hypothetical protein
MASPLAFDHTRTHLNPFVILNWNELLASAIASLSPLGREIITYILEQREGRRPSYSHALAAWSLDRAQFDIELRAMYSDIRQYLRRYGVGTTSDLEFE